MNLPYTMDVNQAADAVLEFALAKSSIHIIIADKTASVT